MVITHDVDEAVYMSNRICMMTNGPAATVGQVLELPFERPRNRKALLEHPDYYEFRGALIAFLERQEARKTTHAPKKAKTDAAKLAVRVKSPSVREHASSGVST